MTNMCVLLQYLLVCSEMAAFVECVQGYMTVIKLFAVIDQPL